VNAIVTRALGLDALYQVLDNKVFRILVIVTLVLVLFPVLIAFRSEEVVVLLGWRRYGYNELFESLGPSIGLRDTGALRMDEMQALAVTAYQDLILTQLMGHFGMFLCIAATAFFVPQMIEKGAADTLFSKPVSRLALFLARYLSGILFVGILSSLLVGGTYLTLLLSSGYSDSDFLWVAPALTYKFALVYAVTVLIAIFTRSTVASILLTLIFVTVNGCIHTGWNIAEMGRETGEQVAEASIGGENVEPPNVTVEVESDDGGVLALIGKAFYFMHYVLPKTGEASAIAGKLRSAFSTEEGASYTDPDTEFVLQEPPPGFEPLDPAALQDEDLFHPAVEGDAVVYAAGYEGRDADARLVVHKRPERELTYGLSGRTRAESTKRAADFLEEWIEEGETRTLDGRGTSVTIAEGTTWTKSARELHWSTERNGVPWQVRTLVVNQDGWIIAFQLETRGDWLTEHPNVRTQVADRNYKFGSGSLDSMQAMQDPDAWIAERLSWTGNWRFNIWFSIGSSIAFVLVCLGVGWLRLSRMDF
jgi:ABC-type transport system involved in multi-copper enzyme maturation permease subunit